ncbi:hypothetical protein TVAG_429910 [Trichomonas vaginalis G3]|uniref:Vps52 / Sac2 family protein n=1 Tax=Trichomonas vaginalis (strain ATCC PRA-98 / G3) TaxID=412133 RepID=A2EI67_TRIV3|nr:Golgi to vacuole transport [Trichomonas vaginalis G3]EAY07627.1 hypothetical protein TVAG_429910 [Trichomonas vaginalis G3]KAI5500525.1 Golgi to vacuole transport [Trichomonas vaginalis G3]|eukprot:XP_001319850.1 hypothetical protein [Trichomonas vaginalis G3]
MSDESFSDVIDDINFDEMENDILNFANEPSVKSYLELGVDLKNYKNQISTELSAAQQASIQDYLKQIPYVTALSNDLNKCDETLQSMEDRLKLFNESLSQMSYYINSIQTKSQEITQKLKNRKEYEALLGEFTRSIAITPEFVREVTESPVGIDYVQTILQLEKKIQFSTRKEIKDINSSQDFLMTLNRLRLRAAENIKNWIIEKTLELVMYPESQPITQENMLRCHKLVEFMKESSLEIDKMCRTNYIENISRYYQEMFYNLWKGVLRKMSQAPLQSDTLAPQQQYFSFFSRRKNTGENTSFFSLGDRQKVLNNLLLPSADIPEGSFSLEFLMQNFYMKYINKVTEEHDFIAAFWADNVMAFSIFSPISKQIEMSMEQLLLKINDPVCVSILLRIISAHRQELNRRRVNCIDQHLNSIEMSLLMRFRLIIQNNISALESTDLSAVIETGHFANAFARRFSEFASSISKLITPANEDNLVPYLDDTAATFCQLFERASKKLPVEKSDAFLINNFIVVANVLRQNGRTTLTQLFDAKHDDACARFVEICIQNHFGDLVSTVKSAYPNIENMNPPTKTNFGPTVLMRIANDFKENHSAEMKTIADSMLTLFGDFTDGRNILRNIAKRTVLYWTKFEQLAKAIMEKDPNSMRWVNSMLSIQQLVLDIRLLTESF